MTTLAIAKMTSIKRLWVLVRLNNIKVDNSLASINCFGLLPLYD
jgi:hypothetical protein